MTTAQPKKKNRLTQAERSAYSDNQMYDAAIKLILEHGPNKTTLTNIGIKAGYSRGLATYRYRSKDAFFSSLVEHLHQLWCKELDKSIQNTRGLQTVIEAVSALQKFVESNPEHLRAMFMLYYESIDHHSEMTQKLEEIHSNQRQQAAQWIKEAIEDDEASTTVSPKNFAELYCALIYGAIYQWLVNPEKIDLYSLLHHCKHSLTLIAKN
ncbi:TetR/AcrR family transcriptional regulator [bacterium AH-315-K03]|nr:TetR/AcrR family transcriptional regulator [bacterium AH-315-K03]